MVVCDDYLALSMEAAQRILAQVNKKTDSVLGLATGSTPLGVYKYLIQANELGKASFKDCTSFNLDEYVGLDGSHDQSYRYFMNTNLFSRIDIKQNRTNVPSGLEKDYEAYCADYEQQIKSAGGIDLQILGLGGNGHVAFHEPGVSLQRGVHVADLDEKTIKDNARFFEKGEAQVPTRAITMGVGNIMQARQVILLASGEKKAKAVAAALEGPITD